jgi:hypothetical protein
LIFGDKLGTNGTHRKPKAMAISPQAGSSGAPNATFFLNKVTKVPAKPPTMPPTKAPTSGPGTASRPGTFGAKAIVWAVALMVMAVVGLSLGGNLGPGSAKALAQGAGLKPGNTATFWDSTTAPEGGPTKPSALVSSGQRFRISGWPPLGKEGNPVRQIAGENAIKAQNSRNAPQPAGARKDTVGRLTAFQQQFLRVDNFTSYFALIFAAMFSYYFLVEFKIGFTIPRIGNVLTLILLFYFTFNDFKCDIYKYLHLYLIPPALYCINITINRMKYVIMPIAILLLAIIYTYEFEIPLIICSLFIVINIFYIIKFLVKHKKHPKFAPYLRQMITLVVIAISGYIVSLHLSKQMYFKAYKFMTSWF